MAEPQDPKIGAVLEKRYRVVQRIASGGMGSVYKGERLQLARPVAIKFLHAWIAGEADAIERFNREAMAMSRLQHPSCVSVIDFGVHEGMPFLVMDYAAGRTLRALLREGGAIAPPRAIAVARQLLAGLEHAHGHGVVHRDVKPDNIVLDDVSGLGLQVRILDFGLAKLRDMQTVLTVGVAVGTPSYMAPEQTLGEPVDARTDVYAAGAVLFEMLVGRKLFEGASAQEIARKQRLAAPPRLAEAAPGKTFSTELEAAVARALAKSAADRFQSAADLAAALDAAPESSAAAAPPAPPPPPAWRRGLRWLPLAAVPLVAAVWLAFPRRPAVAPVAQPPVIEIEPPRAAAAPPEPPPDPDDFLEEARRVAASGSFTTAVKRLTDLRKRHADSAELHYLLANLYLDKLWGEEGFDSARAAIRLEPRYRSDPTLIRNAVNALVSDGNAGRAMRFIREEIGAPAVPFLEEARKSKSLNVSRRAAELLRSIQ